MRTPSKTVYFLLALLLTITGSYFTYHSIWGPNFLMDQEQRSLVVPYQISFESLAQQLQEQKFIQYKWSFQLVAKLLKYDRYIKPGHVEKDLIPQAES